jgi:diguanylate cyclase (GGDEF)-like protein/PAS domain S-box-containing protein
MLSNRFVFIKRETMPPSSTIKALQAQIKTLQEQLDVFQAKTTHAARLGQDKYQRVINATSEGFVRLDLNWIIIDVNHALERMLGYHRNEIIGQPIKRFYDQQKIRFYYASKDHLSFETRFHTSTGNSVPILFNRSVFRDAQDQIIGYLAFLSDLTELKQTQAELQQAEERFRSLYENAVQGMFQSTLSGQVLDANPALARILGYPAPESVIALKDGLQELFVNPGEHDRMINALKKSGYLTNYEVRLKRWDGAEVWLLANVRLVTMPGDPPRLEGIMADHTDRKRAEEKLRHNEARFRWLAVHDNLTGLYNTRHLYKVLDQLIGESRTAGQPFALIFLDMDNFKNVVDTHGHLNGSHALQEVAATIKLALKEPEFAVAYGGDEFVVVLPGKTKDQAWAVAEGIRSRMKQTYYLKSATDGIRLSASFGIAAFPEDAADREGLLGLADRAMFHIKTRGKDAIGLGSGPRLNRPARSG